MERKIQSLEQHVSFLYDELEKKEVEIDDIKERLDKANDKARIKAAANLNDQEDISEMKKVIEEQKIKISCLRKHRNEILDRHENLVDDYEAEFKAKETDIKNLQDVLRIQKQEIGELKEQQDAKLRDIEEKDTILRKLQLKSSQTSLSEELEVANFKEEKGKLRIKVEELEKKCKQFDVEKDKRLKYFEKQSDVFDSMKNEIQNLKSTIVTAKKQEKAKCPLKWNCNRIFCTLDHTYLYRIVNNGSSFVTNTFKCEKCELAFANRTHLENHVKEAHERVSSFNCDDCSFTCRKKKKLVKHVQSKHKGLESKNTVTFIEKVKESDEKQNKSKDTEPKPGCSKQISKLRKNKPKKSSHAKGAQKVADEAGKMENYDDSADEEEMLNYSSDSTNSSDSEMSSLTSASEHSFLKSESEEEDSDQSGGMS